MELRMALLNGNVTKTDNQKEEEKKEVIPLSHSEGIQLTQLYGD